MNFNYGYVGYYNKTNNGYVRCVRSGPSGSFNPLTLSVNASEERDSVPLPVIFSASATGGVQPYSFSWDFGDGTTYSYNQNPTHTYEIPGTYTTTCSVSDSNGDTVTDTILIQVFDLPEEIQSWFVLTDDSAPLTLSLGEYAQIFGSTGMNTVNLETGARAQCLNFVGPNQINLEEDSSQFTVYRFGATIYLNSSAGTLIKIPATQTTQTIRFADGSSGLVITDGKVMLGNQVISRTESVPKIPVDNADASTDNF